jgi:hypothetical protein
LSFLPPGAVGVYHRRGIEILRLAVDGCALAPKVFFCTKLGVLIMGERGSVAEDKPRLRALVGNDD